MVTTYAMPQPSPLVGALLIATASRNAVVELGPDTVRVHLGLTWHTEFTRESVVDAEAVRLRTPNRGAHGRQGRWLVNTSTSGLVRMTLDPTATARCFGIPHQLTELTVSLADPEAFLQALATSAG